MVRFPLEKPNKMLMKNILRRQRNPCTVFMYLELGFLPVKCVIMKKKLTFLRYIFNESMDSMLRKFYEVLKNDNRNGDFINIVQKDLNKREIELTENKIKEIPKTQWKKYVI